MTVEIIKADGTKEPFEREKLIASLQKSGASAKTAEDVVLLVEGDLKENMRTADIYRSAFALLRRNEPHGAAARYSLRRALLEFGPSGFPFELYLAELFKTDGYEAVTNQMITGSCVDHEIDVLLTKNGVHTYVEAKFHNTPGFKTDLKVALYVKARIDDLRTVDSSAKGLLVTNTKLTTKAFQYAQCAGLEVLTWDFPHDCSLQQLIEKAKLYPITALTTLSRREKTALIQERIVLSKSLKEHKDALGQMGISPERISSLFQEIDAL